MAGQHARRRHTQPSPSSQVRLTPLIIHFLWMLGVVQRLSSLYGIQVPTIDKHVYIYVTRIYIYIYIYIIKPLPLGPSHSTPFSLVTHDIGSFKLRKKKKKFWERSSSSSVAYTSNDRQSTSGHPSHRPVLPVLPKPHPSPSPPLLSLSFAVTPPSPCVPPPLAVVRVSRATPHV